jgi:hypothetical protein
MWKLGLRHAIPRKGIHKWDFFEMDGAFVINLAEHIRSMITSSQSLLIE